MKKPMLLLALVVAMISACDDDSIPDFDMARYVLLELDGKPLPAGPGTYFVTIADTLVITPSQRKARQMLTYTNGGIIKYAATELGLIATDGGLAVDFHCISGSACTAIYVPEYGMIRRDTLRFTRGEAVTRTYVRR